MKRRYNHLGHKGNFAFFPLYLLPFREIEKKKDDKLKDIEELGKEKLQKNGG